MALMAEGIWPCKVLSGKFGEDDRGQPQVQVNVQITEGPNTGRRCTYEDVVNARSGLYIGRSCKAVGWKGDKIETLKADIDAWIVATGGETTVEIKHIEIKTGKRAGQIWDKPNSLGRGPRPLKEPARSTLDDANDAMRMAMESDAGDGRDEDAPPSDEPIPF